MNKIASLCNKFMGHIDFKVYTTTVISIFILIGLIPGIIYLPEQFGYENGIFENIQMLILFLACGFALKSKSPDNKTFFTFVFLVLTILMIREVNCGRTIFFPIPGEVNEFYRWNEIKYGWLAHPLFGTYIGLVGIYFLKNKLYLNIINILKTYKLPIWNIILMLIGMTVALYAEEVAHNAIVEEISELLFYTALTSIIFLYTQSKDFLTNKKC